MSEVPSFMTFYWILKNLSAGRWSIVILNGSLSKVVKLLVNYFPAVAAPERQESQVISSGRPYNSRRRTTVRVWRDTDQRYYVLLILVLLCTLLKLYLSVDVFLLWIVISHCSCVRKVFSFFSLYSLCVLSYLIVYGLLSEINLDGWMNLIVM